MARVLRLPDRGRLIVCTDLQGCLRDYRRIVEVFHELMERTEGDAYLLFTGDLVHGPHIEPDEWPELSYRLGLTDGGVRADRRANRTTEVLFPFASPTPCWCEPLLRRT